MKFSELERKIKTEADKIEVPDVYALVKKSSINKLAVGQTPLQAFKKNLAVWLLVFTLIIFAVLSVCLFVFWLTPSPSKNYTGSFICVMVDYADETEAKFDLITDKDGGVVFAYDETLGAETEKFTGYLPEAAVLRALPAENVKSVQISVLNDSDTFAENLAHAIENKIAEHYRGESLSVKIFFSEDADKAGLVSLIQSNKGEADIGFSVERLIESFVETFKDE